MFNSLVLYSIGRSSNLIPFLYRMPLKSKPNGVIAYHRMLTTKGLDRSSLSPGIQKYISEQVEVCRPSSVHVCDGTDAENKALLEKLQEDGRIHKLEKYDNW